MAGVAVRDDVIDVETGPVVIEHAGAVHDVGRFRIELSPTTGARVFLIEQPAGVAVAWIHPHVQADLPCLGNARVGVEKLLGDLQFVAATEVLLRFLGTYDEDTAYCPLGAWPAAVRPAER